LNTLWLVRLLHFYTDIHIAVDCLSSLLYSLTSYGSNILIYMVASECSRNHLTSGNYKTINPLSHISFKIIPSCNYTLLTVVVQVMEIFVGAILWKFFSSSFAFIVMSVASQKRRPFNADFNQGNR
jgi:hypothetical protein